MVLTAEGQTLDNATDAVFRKGGIHGHEKKEKKKTGRFTRSSDTRRAPWGSRVCLSVTDLGRVVRSCGSDDYGKCGDPGARCRGQGTLRWPRTVGTGAAGHAWQQKAVLPTEMPAPRGLGTRRRGHRGLKPGSEIQVSPCCQRYRHTKLRVKAFLSSLPVCFLS